MPVLRSEDVKVETPVSQNTIADVTAPAAIAAPLPSPAKRVTDRRPVVAGGSAPSVQDILGSEHYLHFQVAPGGKVVVQVVDARTQTVIRQMPSEELLAIAKALDRVQGLLVHQEA